MTKERDVLRRIGPIWEKARIRRRRRALRFMAVLDETGFIDRDTLDLMNEADALMRRLETWPTYPSR